MTFRSRRAPPTGTRSTRRPPDVARPRPIPRTAIVSPGFPFGKRATPLDRRLLTAAAAVSAGLASLAVVVHVDSPSLVGGIAIVTFLSLSAWMFFSERYTLTLAVLALYLGLVDGYLKLRTGSEYATLARDVLLYAISLGLFVRWLVRREEARLPPYSGVVLAYVLLVIVQLANPETGGLGRGLAALRPHLEFVPLFFLTYMTIRTKSRLRGLVALLVVVGAANGVVSYIQFGLTPEQLASWGPGYAERIEGTDEVSSRTFGDDRNQLRVRPFGLGADSGAGGVTGLLALPAVIALISLYRGRWRSVAITLGFAVILAIVTSQARQVMIAAFLALVGYVILTVVSRRLIPTLAGIAAVAVMLGLAASLSSNAAGRGAFDRVEEIAPSRLLESASEQRGSSLVLAPTMAAQYPLGAGLGSVGPAASFGRERERGFNNETEFNFLIIELGVAAACLFLGLVAMILARTRRLRAITDPELRVLLAALAAPLIGMVVMFFASSTTAGSPASPYFWAVSGALVYWLRPSAYDKRRDP
jgi:hypothetical protein